MLIEFLGVPGCGKSTLSRHLAETLMDHRLVVDETTYDIDHRRRTLHRQWLKLSLILTYAARSPRSAVSEFITIAGTRQASVADLKRAAFNWLFIRSVAARRRPPSVITILDQGFAQALWTTGFAAARASWLELLRGRHMHRAALPNLVVHVRADLATIGDRLEKRRQHASRMDGLGRNPDALRRAETISELVASRLQAIGIPIIEADNNDASQLMLSAHRVAAEIMTRLNEPQTPVRTPDPRYLSIEEATPLRLVTNEDSSSRQRAAPVLLKAPMTAAVMQSDQDA